MLLYVLVYACIHMQNKDEENERIHKQLNDSIDDLNAKMEDLKKENQDNKLTLEKEHQKCLELAVSKLANYHMCYCTLLLCTYCYVCIHVHVIIQDL